MALAAGRVSSGQIPIRTGGLDVTQRHDAKRLVRQGGFALILAMLALLLLTFLGLTLATTTSTELQIATNYRWSEQALYVAEAGVEAGRIFLRGVADWNTILPTARDGVTWNTATVDPAALPVGGGTSATFARNDEWGNATRNFEAGTCDKYSRGVGYGVVLDDGSAAAPYQYKTTVFGRTLPGAFTIWVRRPVWRDAVGTLTDYAISNGTLCATCDDDNIIMVVEGVAPFITGAAGVQGRAVRVLEYTLSKATPLATGPCGSRAGQTGGGPEGANFSACDPVTGAGIGTGLGGGTTATEQSGVQ